MREIQHRGRAEFLARLERVGVGAHARLPSSREVLTAFGLESGGSGMDLIQRLRAEARNYFFSAFQDLETTVDQVKSRFPAEADDLIKQADRVCDGRFDLLGYRDLYFDGKVPNWHMDPISGNTAPTVHWSVVDLEHISAELDIKVVWELNRHQYFSVLGRAYLLTGEVKYFETFVQHIEDWFDSNPPKIGVNWASSLEVAFRSISWVWSLQCFLDSDKLDPDFVMRLLKFLFLHGRHLENYLSTYSSPNTHLTGEGLGLYFIGNLLASTEEGSRWRKLGYTVMLDALEFQVRDDGTYCEQSSHYHRYTTDFFLHLMLLRLATGEPVTEKHRTVVEKLLEFILYITQPDGRISLYGDEDGGRLAFLDSRETDDVRGTLATGATVFGRGDFKFVAGEPTAELVWLLGHQGLENFDDLVAVEPSKRSIAFSEGGAYVMRRSWGRDSGFVLIHCGQHGFLNGGHAHADALSFVLALEGEALFVDSGTYKYASDAVARDIFRSSQSHNSLTVNDQSSSVPAGPWSWGSIANCSLINWRENEEGVALCGQHDGFRRFGVQYKRYVEFKFVRHVVVTDSVLCSSRNTYQVHFILSPEWQAELKGESIEVRKRNAPDGTSVVIKSRLESVRPVERFEWTIVPWFVSLRYGSKTASTKLVLNVDATGDLQIINEMFIKNIGFPNLQEKG